MNVLWDILIGFLLVVVAMYAFFTIRVVWCIFHDTPSSGSSKNETACEEERRRRKEQAEALQDLREMWMAKAARDAAMQQHQDAHDTAVRLHQEAHDTAVRIHRQAQDDAVWAHESAHSGCEQWDDGIMDYGSEDYDYGCDCGCTDYYCDDTSTQQSFALAADMHNSAINDAAFTAQSDFSMFGASGFEF